MTVYRATCQHCEAMSRPDSEKEQAHQWANAHIDARHPLDAEVSILIDELEV